jgi:hypothetical protein
MEPKPTAVGQLQKVEKAAPTLEILMQDFKLALELKVLV